MTDRRKVTDCNPDVLGYIRGRYEKSIDGKGRVEVHRRVPQVSRRPVEHLR